MEKTAMKTFDSNLISPKSPTLLNDRDASFSSYLIPEKPNTCQPHHHHHHHHNHHTLDDSTSELSIFDAHKYFNEVTNNNNIQKVTISSSNNNNSSSRVSPVVVNVNTETERIVIPETTTRYSSASSSVDGYSSIRNYRTRSFHAATPTASSEASWNSQQGLLSYPPGAISVSMKNPQNPNPDNDLNNKLRKSLSKPIWLLRRKCPCTGKKSVQVNEKKSTELPKTKKIPSPTEQTQHNTVNMETVSPKNWDNLDQTQTRVAVKSQRFPSHSVVTTVRVPFTEGFTFPVLDPNATSAAKHGVPNGVVLDDTPRDSLEVFRPPDEVAVQAKHLGIPFPPAISRVVVADDGDAASDASSDLFEIESFSNGTQSTCPIVCHRSSRDSFDDGLATPAMTECYEPSEASIEWSVTTAEGYEESSGGGGGGAAAEQWKRKGGSGLFVSCRCEKAVSVGPHPQPVKFGGGEGQRGATSAWRHVSGGGANSNSSGSISRIGGVNKPPLARSHRNTPRVTSLAFAT